MDIPAEKYKLIEWLISIEDEAIILKLQDLRKEALESGESYRISDEEELSIQAGLKDLEEGNTFSHEEVMREVREKYGLEANGNDLK